VFPELEDARALAWNRLVEGEYEERVVAPGGRVSSSVVPELEVHVLPRERWSPGSKLEIYWRGELRPRLVGERLRAALSEARAERLAARLRELGVDPDE
jgi:diadenosine tetraphosphate (Ap4A) HIT family hydrolase